MPTEKQIEAGCKAFVDHLNEQGGDNAVWPHDFFESDQAVFRSMVSGIISAAYANGEDGQADEEARGQAVPDQRYPIRQEASGMWTTSGMPIPAMAHAFPPDCETFCTAEAAYAVCRERNGYVRPDLEAAIRADERERLAKAAKLARDA